MQNEICPNTGILLKGVLVPRWFCNSEFSCSMINLGFLLAHTTHKSVIFHLLIFVTSGFLLFLFYSFYFTLQETSSYNFINLYTLVLYYSLDF